jgi:hypothetical protein
MDAYLEEELYDDLTYSIQNPSGSDFEPKKKRIEDIGRELYADGGTDAMENMFYSIEFRVKEELARMLSHIAHGGTIYLQNGSINALARLSDV